ncbi:uncharacterized protein PODANS_4_120 [Podospora anserina S mat+]|uniref:Amino acid transporter n=1 Tax=Podospora anserina (strain S / ATCC MYA-4624 / DSM 980 / FGSC 10383) TaxID=515849 RepID=B2AD54_PODAN|nr:uncharacterized protein PODANS_4_120 [Podospora anserina S mat+]CAP61369.1 unnamed protein product [Podospora anserina S mat+]CDP27724.1 Putative amino acid transporter [Podospora anserina S mat+]
MSVNRTASVSSAGNHRSTSSSSAKSNREHLLPEADVQAQVVAEHLPAGFTAEFDATLPAPKSKLVLATTSRSNSTANTTKNHSAAAESSLKLQGGDIHRELFRLAASEGGPGGTSQIRSGSVHRRANTFHNPREYRRSLAAEEGLSVGDQLAPGGFRRAYLLQKRRNGKPNDFYAARMPITRNFVEFLNLYGHFAGEDLEDSDEEAVESESEDEDGERRPLLTTTRERQRQREREEEAEGREGAGMTKTFFTLLKAFVGTGIMFLPKAFSNGGLLFSSLAMVGVSAISMWAFHLLLGLKERYRGGYGEIGYAVAGGRMRGLILASIALSQLGFVCAGIVFVAENLLTFFEAVMKDSRSFTTAGLIALQLVILVPLSWIRNISKLGPAALLADACILVGVTYIYWHDITSLVDMGGMDKGVVMFNPDRYTMMVGSAIFTFEGIGLILPIQSSMARPEKFEWLLGVVMLIITIVFTSVGALCYATFGLDTQIEIINNFPQDSKLVNAIQFLYSVAILVGTPVQLFPALRILETKIFGRKSGKKSLKTKWIKNGFRFAMVCLCGVISVLGTGNLDKFVALIGSAACVPLVYVYPAWLHYKGAAETKAAKLGDLAMVVLGLVGMVYTTAVTIINSFM